MSPRIETLLAQEIRAGTETKASVPGFPDYPKPIGAAGFHGVAGEFKVPLPKVQLAFGRQW
jgi:hypothetical protein